MPTYTVDFYNFNPLGAIPTGTGSTFTWTGPTVPAGTAIITDNEAGIEGLTLDDDTAGGETATADVTVGGNTSTGSTVDAETVWTVRDTVTGEVFEVIQFEVETGTAAGNYALSEVPFIDGRIYEVVAFTDDSDVTAGDPAFSIEDYEPLGAEINGTAGSDTIGATYVDAQGDRVTSGKDTVFAGAGDDTVYGGGGSDTVFGGDGNDFLQGSEQSSSSIGIGGTNTVESTFTVINLGNYADVDPDESDSISENAGDLLGTYGGVGDELYNNLQTATTFNTNANTSVDDNDNNQTPEDIVIDGVTYQLDSTQVYTATVTFLDGSNGTFEAIVSQTTTGETFLMPQLSLNADQTLLNLQPIVSVSLDTLDSATNVLTANRIDADYKVPLISPDTSGDSIDGGAGNDTLIGDLGDDTLDGGLDDDTAYGGDGDDLLSGDAGNDLLYGDDGEAIPVTVANSSFDSGTTGWTVAGAGTDVYGVDGNNALAFNASDSASGGTLEQTVNTQTGRDYDLSVDASEFDFGGAVGDHTLVIEVIDSNGQVIATRTDVIADESSQTLTLAFTSTTADVTLRFSNPSSTETISTDLRVDNITVTEVASSGTGNDTLDGGDGSDTLFGGAGDDLLISGGETVDDTLNELNGGNGNDTIRIEGPFNANDQIDGGAGIDELQLLPDDNRDLNVNMVVGNVADGTIGAQEYTSIENVTTGGGNDTIIGDGVDNVLNGGAGADSIDGGDGNDALDGGDGNDFITGGDGRDTLSGGAGDDSLLGGNSDDTFLLRDFFGNDTIIGGEGGETTGDTLDLSAVTGAGLSVTMTDAEAGTVNAPISTVTFSEIENIILTDQDDTFIGQTTEGGAGVFVDGRDGNDSLQGGTGDDTLTGGTGDDIFMVSDGLDTIVDFNANTTGPIDDGDQTNNDFADLSAYYDNLLELYADQNDDGILNQSNAQDTKGRTVEYSDNSQFSSGGGINFTGATGDASFFSVENTGVVCFAKGTRILTLAGEVPIEHLSPDDKIVTRDNGPKSLLWLASRALSSDDLAADPKKRPIHIAPDLVGGTSPLIVSPQHGVLLRGGGKGEILVRATHLARLKGGRARVMDGCRQIEYFHLLFDDHQIVFANGAPAESFYPGPNAFGALSKKARGEVCELFPDLSPREVGKTYGKPARDFAAFRDLPERLAGLMPA